MVLQKFHSDLPFSEPEHVPSSFGKIGVLGFVFSSAGPAAATILSNPLDVSKVRLQMQTGRGKAAKAMYKGTFDCLWKTFRKEGMKGVQSGLGPSTVKEATKNLFRIGLFEPSLRYLNPDPDVKPHLWQRMCAGSFSGAIGSLLCNPLDLVKTRVQLQAINPKDTGPRYKGTWDAISRMVRNDGVASLWKGTGVNVLRSVIATSVVMTVNSALKDQINSPAGLYGLKGEGAGVDALCSLIAAFAAVASMNPIDVVRTRLYNQTKGQMSSSIECFLQILRNEGPLAFYKGATSHVMRFGPHNVFTFVFIGMFQRLARHAQEYRQERMWDAQLHSAFASFDVDHDGVLSQAEVKYALYSILKEKEGGPEFDQRIDKASSEVMAKSDKDRSGTVEFSEFADMCHELDLVARDIELEIVFKQLDSNGDGMVDVEEVIRAIQSLMPDRKLMTSSSEDKGVIRAALDSSTLTSQKGKIYPMDFEAFKVLCSDIPRVTRQEVVRNLLADAGVGLQ